MTPLETELREMAADCYGYDAQLAPSHIEMRDLLTRAADAVAEDRALISSLADQLNKHVGREAPR